jgi:hypothetical protein
MLGLVGGGLIAVGALQTLGVLTGGPIQLGRDLVEAPTDTRCQRISRVVANALFLIGSFCSGLGLLAAGATLWSLAPGMTLLPGVELALSASLGYLTAGLSALTSHWIIWHAAR